MGSYLQLVVHLFTMNNLLNVRKNIPHSSSVKIFYKDQNTPRNMNPPVMSGHGSGESKEVRFVLMNGFANQSLYPTNYTQQTIHNINYKNIKILHKDKNYSNLKIYRSLYIKNNAKTITLKPGTNNLNNITTYLSN